MICTWKPYLTKPRNDGKITEASNPVKSGIGRLLRGFFYLFADSHEICGRDCEVLFRDHIMQGERHD